METFSAGLVLSTGLRMFARVGLRYLPVILLIHAPLVYFHVMMHLAEPGLEQASAMVRANRWFWLVLVLDIPTAAIITQAVIRAMRGKNAGMIAIVLAGLRRTPHALIVMILVYLVGFALAFAVGIPSRAAANLDPSGTLSAVFSIAWLAMCVAVYSRWFVAIPAIVIERPESPSAALTRSNELTEGRRLRIAGIIVVTNVLAVAVIIGVVALAENARGEDPRSWILGIDSAWTSSLLVAVFAFFFVLRAVMSAVAYFYIRTETEAQSPESLAKVFD